jgi:hypothetical protein
MFKDKPLSELGALLLEVQKRNALRIQMMKSMGMLVYRPDGAQSIAQLGRHNDLDTGFIQALKDGELRQ